MCDGIQSEHKERRRPRLLVTEMTRSTHCIVATSHIFTMTFIYNSFAWRRKMRGHFQPSATRAQICNLQARVQSRISSAKCLIEAAAAAAPHPRCHPALPLGEARLATAAHSVTSWTESSIWIPKEVGPRASLAGNPLLAARRRGLQALITIAHREIGHDLRQDRALHRLEGRRRSAVRVHVRFRGRHRDGARRYELVHSQAASSLHVDGVIQAEAVGGPALQRSMRNRASAVTVYCKRCNRYRHARLSAIHTQCAIFNLSSFNNDDTSTNISAYSTVFG